MYQRNGVLADVDRCIFDTHNAYCLTFEFDFIYPVISLPAYIEQTAITLDNILACFFFEINLGGARIPQLPLFTLTYYRWT
jgi:hypothetical protein